MTVLKQYNTSTSTWDTVVVGQPGEPGIVTASTAPADTSVLWMDTADTASQVAVPSGGTAGQVLAKTSGTDYATGWIDNPGSRNAIINSAFDIWQRGTSLAGGAATYVSDRWMGYRGAYASGSTYSRQSAGLDGIRYCMRVQRDSGNSATNPLFLDNPLDTDSSVPFQGKTVTFSFYARAGANFSSSSSLIGFAVYGGTGIDQKAVSGFTNQVTMHNASFALTSSWQRFTTSFSVASNINGFTPELFYIPTGTAGAADYFEVTGVQLEVGNVATPFKRNAPSIQAELAACQRYYVRYAWSNSNNEPIGMGQATGTTIGQITVSLPVELRTYAASVEYSSLVLTDRSSYSIPVTAVTLDGSGKKAVAVRMDVASGLTVYRPLVATIGGTGTGYL